MTDVLKAKRRSMMWVASSFKMRHEGVVKAFYERMGGAPPHTRVHSANRWNRSRELTEASNTDACEIEGLIMRFTEEPIVHARKEGPHG